jgi:hypothetical protein
MLGVARYHTITLPKAGRTILLVPHSKSAFEVAAVCHCG